MVICVVKSEVTSYYRSRFRASHPDDLYWQVGKTVNGKSVDAGQLQLIVDAIKIGLGLTSTDAVLDVGCGNGLLTREIAGSVRSVDGIELTPELCEVATRNCLADNIRYFQGDVLTFDVGVVYDKIYLYEVIQHFNLNAAKQLIERLLTLLPPNGKLFVGGVLDEERKWHFFDTEERRFYYFESILSPGKNIGHWCHRDVFKWLCKNSSCRVTVFQQNIELYTSHYRFDVLIEKGV